MKNHKTEYKYNYEVLERELMYLKTELKNIIPDLSGDPQMFIKRQLVTIEAALTETSSNLKQPKEV